LSKASPGRFLFAQLDAFTAGQRDGDLTEYRLNDQLDIRLPQMRIACGEISDEVRPGHRRHPGQGGCHMD
jgi:hypothetical protein